ncbi:unnamed protein product [Rotaria magnacalcarata]|uniref:Uncharacterized protein n=2 Tax=Rotaria magnacalcarata TaxID=392030 RepID=A0A814NVV5_9BILA|nr:unnamed protein product [Rotaria magnacalcarata]CAF1231330.1 unnamed protein product [Rotaria magnacalcarata]CAF1918611.1 unnamed protein product [Rotaria magnacalcarata]CAF4669685.1 unnamed protein product [Rotaria magnacalcarata]CAF4698131.1 unnamed protein product [Rotaria magnacalcarata]
MITDSKSFTASIAPSENILPILVDYNISQITPYLYVTAEDTAREFSKVFSHGIGCVINVAQELPQIMFPPQTGIESFKYPIIDTPAFPALHYFDVVADRIAVNTASNRRTLLYCRQGRSRSITFILAYLIKHHHLPLQTAYSLVKSRRQIAQPNVGFWSQLRSYEVTQQKMTASINGYPQNPITYGGQVFNKLSNGLDSIIAQVPMVNTFTNMMGPISENTQIGPYHNGRQRRRSVYSHPQDIGHRARILQRPNF